MSRYSFGNNDDAASVSSSRQRNPPPNMVGSLMQPDLYDSYRSPRPVPRVGFSSKAAENLERSRGSSMSDCLQHPQPSGSPSFNDNSTHQPVSILPSADDTNAPRQVPRVVGRQASDILQRHSGVAMASVIVSDGVPPVGDDRPRPRVSGTAAKAIAEHHSGAAASRVLDHYANRGYETPRSRPRVRNADAADVAHRGSGGLAMSAALNHEANVDYSSARGPRINGSSGEDILQRGVVGSVGDVMQFDANVGYSSPRPLQRVSGERAEMIAEKGRGLHIAKVMDSKANVDYNSPRPTQPRVRDGQGQEIASRGINGTMSKVIRQQSSSNGDHEDSRTPRPEPRIRPEARDIAMAHQQGTFGQVLVGDMPASPVPAARVTEKSLDNYDRGSRGTLGNLMTEYGKLPLSGRPASRVKYDGSRIAEYGQTGNVKNLFNEYGNLPQSARPEPRVRPEAKAIARKNMGTMSELMTD